MQTPKHFETRTEDEQSSAPAWRSRSPGAVLEETIISCKKRQMQYNVRQTGYQGQPIDAWDTIQERHTSRKIDAKPNMTRSQQITICLCTRREHAHSPALNNCTAWSPRIL